MVVHSVLFSKKHWIVSALLATTGVMAFFVVWRSSGCHQASIYDDLAQLKRIGYAIEDYVRNRGEYPATVGAGLNMR